MERLAYLAWGSLVWDPRSLPLQSTWFIDGPSIRVEFARKSKDGRLTLVLGDDWDLVPSLWALAGTDSMADAVESLGDREGIYAQARATRLGQWRPGQDDPPYITGIATWAQRHNITGAIWTDLRSNFDHGTVPDVEHILKYLRGLPGEPLAAAEEYVRKAPRQIRTRYRAQIEAAFGWTPIDPG